MFGFKIKRKKSGPMVLVTLEGDVVLGECQEFESFLNDMIEEGKNKIVLDCSRAGVFSTQAVRVFLSVLEKCRKNGGDIKLIHVTEGLRRLLTVQGVLALVEIFPDITSAESAFGGGVSKIEKYLLWKIKS